VRVSLEWISDYVDLPAEVDPSALARDLTLKTVEVEDVVRVADDVVLEIDNKSLTNRPDLWGHYGIARELAAIYRRTLVPLPTWSLPPESQGLVGTLDPALCTRFAAATFTLDGAATTPEWIRRRLAHIGEASGDFCVDLGNYVMFSVGQPVHVYDATSVQLPLSARFTDEPQTFELLTGRKVELAAGNPVIVDAREVVGVAGIMGGAASAVRAASTRFVLEAATFRPRPVRQATQRLGLRTEASSRYEKGLDTQRVGAAVQMFLSLLHNEAQASVDAVQDVVVEPTTPARITVGRAFLDGRIGQRLDDGDIGDPLTRLGFEVDLARDRVQVTAPAWRSTGDVSLPQDVLEEVARIHGYDRLPSADVSVTLRPVRSLHRASIDRAVREQLASHAGLQEVLTYPWTADHLLAAVGHPKDATVRFEGAAAPDRDSLRPSLLPNLLEAITANLRYVPAFGIFEVGTVFGAGDQSPYKGVYEALPPQTSMLGIALVGGDGVELFRRAKGILEMLRRRCFITDLELHGDSDAAWADASARVGLRVAGGQAGTLGLVTPRTLRLAGVGGVQVAYAEVDLSPLTTYPSRENAYVPVPDLPQADFDLSVVVADDIPWARVEAVTRAADDLVAAVAYLDEYRGSWVPDGHRSLSLRVTLQPRTATLTADEIAGARQAVLDELGRHLDAHLR